MLIEQGVTSVFVSWRPPPGEVKGYKVGLPHPYPEMERPPDYHARTILTIGRLEPSTQGYVKPSNGIYACIGITGSVKRLSLLHAECSLYTVPKATPTHTHTQNEFFMRGSRPCGSGSTLTCGRPASTLAAGRLATLISAAQLWLRAL